jgi:ABC-type amino acid transport substrate-binding protein
VRKIQAKIMVKFVLTLVISLLLSCQVRAIEVNLAVGPDHKEMMTHDYPLYAASWNFLNMVLREQGHALVAHPMPWARAKNQVLKGKLDGLFLSANLKGRDQWALLTSPLGYDYFGLFKNDITEVSNTVGIVRIGEHDQIHSSLQDKKLIEVATAHVGLQLLMTNKVDGFAMSEGYGKFLLGTHFKKANHQVTFDYKGAERRSAHIAVSKSHKDKDLVLNLLNNAIAHGKAQGYYQTIMTNYGVDELHQAH